ncbi:MAG: hypothetical protein ACYS21_05195 [Planctomycetota bacterium]|jgi:hypothetical protein
MSVEEQEHPLDKLQNLLEKQIEAAQEGNLTNVELLSKQADSLVGQIARSDILRHSELRGRREQLQKLYDNLCLAITAQRGDLSEKLSRIRKARKTLETYHRNISV